MELYKHQQDKLVIYPKVSNHEDIEFKECWALENLQPLEKIANI